MSSLLTRLVRVDGQHGGEDFADLAFSGLMGSNPDKHQYRHKNDRIRYAESFNKEN